MAKKFLTGLTLVNLPSDPSVGSEGELYFNTSSSVARIYKSGTWADLDTVGGGSLTQEQIQDYVAPLFTNATNTNVIATYDDANNVINLNTSGSLISVDSIRYPDFITFDTTPEIIPTEQGSIYWDSGDTGLRILANNTSVLVGQEQYATVKNTTGGTLAKGKVVYINGAQGQRPTVALADADTEITSSKTFGFAGEEIASEAEGIIVTEGILRGINTLGLTEGDPVYLSSTAGNFTQTKPAAPTNLVFLGYVVKAHESAGEIFVKIQNGYELEELHDVLVTGIENDEILRYSTSASVWINTKENLTTARNYSNATINAFMPVYFDTQFLDSTEITFDIADALNELSLPANGITTASVAHGSYSKILTKGIVSGIDLTGYTDGDLLYVAASGGFTKTIPSGSSYIQPIARVLSTDNGTIYFFGSDFASSINTLPNLDSGKVWYGTSGRPLDTTLNTTIVPEGSNLYFTDERAQDATSSMITNGVHTGISVEYVDSSNIFNLTNTGVRSISGTANEISVSASTGNITISIPDSPVFVTPDIGVATATSINGTTIPSSSTLLTSSNIGSTVQAYDADLSSIAGLTGTAGLLSTNGSGIWYVDTNTYSTTAHNHTLDSLSNVVITGTPSDGQAIVWDTTTSKWVNETVSGGGASYPDQTGNDGKFLQTNSGSVSWQNVDFTGYLTESSASTIYLTQSSASSTYQPIGSYLTSESDTLETVTDRGASSTNAITISNTTQATNATTGALIVSGGVGVAKDLWIDGNLHVAGTTTTENTKTVATHDNLIYLNAALDSTITDAVYSSGSITYTADNLYTAGMDIRITGIDPAGFNIDTEDSLIVASATPTYFIVEKSDPGASYISGGTAHAKEEANPDLGFAGGYYDSGYAHAGLFRDASDGIFKFFKGYTPEPDEAVNIDTGHASFSLADVYTNDITSNNGAFSGSVSVGALISGEWNASPIGYQYGGTGLTSLGSAGYVLAVNGTEDGIEWIEMGGGGSSFTNSSELAALLSDETGTGKVVFNTSPTFLSSINIGDSSISTASQSLQIGNGRTDSGYAYIDLVGDTTYPDYGLRLIRNNNGANADSTINHRGTGNLRLIAEDAGAINIATSNTNRLVISSSGDMTFKSTVNTDVSTGTTSATSSFNTTVYSSAEFIVYGSTSTGNYVSKVMMLARGSATPIITEYAILTQGTAPVVTITPSYSAPNAVLTVEVTSGTNIEIVKTAVSI